MNPGIISNIINKGRGFVLRNSGAICTGLGIAATASIPVFAVKATPKALILIEEAKDEKGVDDLTPIEIVQATWKVYIPTAATTIIAIALLAAAYRATSAQKAALASAYSIMEKTLDKYQEKVIDIIGEDKDKEIRGEVAHEVMMETSKNEPLILIGNGEKLCYDGITGRYFRSDIESIREAMNDFNQSLNGDFYQDLNYWYICLDNDDLPQTQVGGLLGWNSNKLMDINFTANISPKGEPCIVLDYSRSMPTPYFRG